MFLRLKVKWPARRKRSGWMQITERYFGVDRVEQVHAWPSHLVLAPVIVQVLLMSRLQGESLVRAMFTRRKRTRNA
jgi:hypothetical protein